MSPLQRYVSRELTHFVGRGDKGPIAIEDQYRRLRAILTPPCLLSRHPDRPGVMDPINIDGFRRMCENEMFGHDAICFCDIPIEEFEIHTGKYGSVGLSFLKAFLVPRGASPVFYVARDSIAGVDFAEGRPRQMLARENLFDTQTFDFVGLHVQRREWMEQQRTFPDDAAELVDHINRLSHPSWFLYYHVFSFVKCFDSTLQEDHEQNFYMEREWRISGDLQFDLGDIWRVILPREYVRRFRSDFPGYKGQITFADR